MVVDLYGSCAHDRILYWGWPALAGQFRCGCLGTGQSDQLGLGDCEFRFLDWYRSRRNADFGGALPA